jgi:hypothetical protein
LLIASNASPRIVTEESGEGGRRRRAEGRRAVIGKLAVEKCPGNTVAIGLKEYDLLDILELRYLSATAS